MRSDRDKRSPWPWALISALVYFLLRMIQHQRILRAGYSDGGLLSYDSFYQLAFAQELKRTGSWLYFQNPFGSLDEDPALFNLYASFLRIIQAPQIESIFVFDLILSTVCVGIGSYFLAKLLKGTSPLIKGLALFGSGFSFLAMAAGFLDATSVIYGGGAWGLTYLLNQISTPEIVYHMLFFIGVCSLLEKKRSLYVIGVATCLAFMHPFTGVTFQVVLFFSFLFHTWREKSLFNARTRVFGVTSLVTAISLLVFQVILPSISKDAAFFRAAYQEHAFMVPPHLYVFFLGFPAGLLVISTLVLHAPPRKTILHDERFFIFLGVSIFCLLMGLAGHVGLSVVQPAHWTRAYPYVFLFGALGISLNALESKYRSKMNRILWAVAVVVLADQAVALYNISEEQLYHARAPSVVHSDDEKILEVLAKRPAAKFIYFRACSNKNPIGDLEYFLMSRSSHTAPFGHVYFSPFLERYGEMTRLCHPAQEASLPLLAREFSYVIYDADIKAHFAFLTDPPMFSGHTRVLQSVSPSPPE